MEEITVHPTTSRELIDSSLLKKFEKDFGEADVPVLCVTSNLSQSIAINIIKPVLINMDKTIHIDTENKHILLGDKEHPFIESDDLKDSPMIDHFFKRWSETGILILAFNFYHNKKFLYCLKGIWQKNEWIDIVFSTKLSIDTIFLGESNK